MHIDTLSMTGKIEELHYQRLRHKEQHLRSLEIYQKVHSGDVRFLSDLTHRDAVEFFKVFFREVFQCDLIKNEAGKNGYESSYGIYHGVHMKACGFLAIGGNEDSYQFYINGAGCAILADKFPKFYHTASFFEMKITRIDVAQDFFEGEFDIQYALSNYKKGSFQSSTRGRKPTAKYVDDMGSGEGKTLYVGKLASSGREVCVYEKGKQLNSEKYPNWVRWELRLGKRDRVLPLDVLINFESYFVAELPVLAVICKGLNLMTHAVSSLRAQKQRVQASMAHLIKYGRIMYGKLIHVMDGLYGTEQVIEKLRVEGAPRRLNEAMLIPDARDLLKLKLRAESYA